MEEAPPFVKRPRSVGPIFRNPFEFLVTDVVNVKSLSVEKDNKRK
jgi:hypothetical protein